jgi:hypothetical protein
MSGKGGEYHGAQDKPDRLHNINYHRRFSMKIAFFFFKNTSGKDGDICRYASCA